MDSARKALARYDEAPPGGSGHLPAALECVGLLRAMVDREDSAEAVGKLRIAAADAEAQRKGMRTMWRWPW